MKFQKEYTKEEIQNIIKKSNKYEQSFHNTSSILGNIAESIPQFIFWKDNNSIYLGSNKLFANLVGFESPEQLVGKTDYDLDWQSTGHAAEHFQKDDKETMAGRLVANKEEILSFPNGKLLITIVSKRPIIDRGKVVGVIGLFTDVTELSSAKKRAEIASRSKSEFIANMSHDLRTPITGMLGMVQDMLYTADQAKSSINDTDAQRSSIALKDMIETVQRDGHFLIGATHELLQLCNEILEVTRIESGASDKHVESFDLHDLLSHNIELFQPTSQHKQLGLSYDMDPLVPRYLKGSRIYLDRILLNLIGNGLKFTEKGEVRIGVSLHEDITDPAMGQTIKLKIQVKDTGIGIPEDKFDEIFEHFSRLTPSYEGVYKGSGLGLYTVKRYIEAIQGTINVASEVGRGTCFTMIFPLTISDHVDRVRQSIRVPVSTKLAADTNLLKEKRSVLAQDATASVLIVEDNPIAAMAEKLAFKPFNCHIDIAVSGTEAVSMAEKKHYDLILMDVGLPDFSGIEATKKIRALNNPTQSQVPIVALTGHADNAEIQQDAIDAGMQEILIKPVHALALETVLETYVFQEKTKE